MWTLLVLTVLAAGLNACSRDGKKSAHPATSDGPGASVDPAQRQADLLGRDLFEVVDRVMSFRSSHQGRLPKDLRLLGVDSLTPGTIRRYRADDKTPVVTVATRHPEEGPVRTCTGTNQVLEDASLNSDAFSVSCTIESGETRIFRVQRHPGDVAP